MGQRPGTNTGSNGGIFREVGPRGGARDSYAAVPDNRPLPPTSGAGATWVRTHRTPDSSR